jgi:hypothetical protein
LCCWQEWLRTINRLLADPKHIAHQTFLEGLREDLVRGRHINARQMVDLQRIQDGLGRRRD